VSAETFFIRRGWWFKKRPFYYSQCLYHLTANIEKCIKYILETHTSFVDNAKTFDNAIDQDLIEEKISKPPYKCNSGLYNTKILQ